MEMTGHNHSICHLFVIFQCFLTSLFLCIFAAEMFYTKSYQFYGHTDYSFKSED